MKRFLLLAFIVPSLGALLLAQPTREVSTSFVELSATIQTQLEGHGDRVLGHEILRWSTRLEKISECRAEFTVRVTNNFGDATVRVEHVNFSLGAVEPYGIDLQKSWLELPCTGGEKCIFSTSTCSRKTKSGIVTDCATASQKRDQTFPLQFDGDAVAGSRLKQAFRQAVDLCRVPRVVRF